MANDIWDEIGHNTFFKLIKQSESAHKMGHWIFDLVQPRMYWTQGMYDIHEVTDFEVTSFEEAIAYGTEESRNRITEDLAKCIAGKNAVDEVYRIITPTGIPKCVRLVANPIIENNEVSRLYGTLTDITKQRKVLNHLEFNKHILGGISEAVFGADIDGSILYWNESAEILFRVSLDDAIKSSITEIGISERISDFIKAYKSGSRSNYSFVWSFVQESEQVLYIDTTLSPMLNEDLEVSGFIGISRNITELKQREIRINELVEEVQKRESKYKTLIDNGEDVACIITEEGIIEYISENVYSVIQKKPSDLIGTPFFDHILDEYLDLNRKNLEWVLVNPNKLFKTEQQIQKANGEKIWIESVSRNLLDDPNIRGIISTFRDITHKKHFIQKQQQALLLAEEMTAMKTNFLATMSHEIRTPLNGILGTAELMELEAVSDSIKELVGIQKESGYRLLNTLNSILAMTKLEAENEDAQLNIVSISHLFDETYSLYQAKAKLKGLNLSVKRPDTIHVKANLGMLSQCINNLVDNALKFTKKGTISMHAYRDKKHVIIEVIDTGIGISEKAQERIFEPFWQAQMGQTRQYQGTGLGLSIVKRYVEFIGGTIQLSSKVNAGSIFQINLPAVNTD